MLGAGNDGQFKYLAGLLQRPELATDPKYATNQARVANRESLIPLLSSLLKTRPSEEWLSEIKGRIPVAPIRNIHETFHHPQAIARGVTTQVNHPRAGKLTIASPAVRYGEGKMQVSRPPPVLGQHTDEILAELGYDAAEVDKLRSSGAIGR